MRHVCSPVAGVLLLLASGQANAGLEGDEIVVSERYPTAEDVHNPQTTVVESGSADTVTTPGQNATTIDVDPDAITLTFGCGFAACYRIPGSVSFSGLALSDLDWSTPPGPPVRLEVESSSYFDPKRIRLREGEIVVDLLSRVWEDQDSIRIIPIYAPQVAIEVLPDSPRAVVPRNGRISVAILGAADVDIRELDLFSLRFGPGEATIVSSGSTKPVQLFVLSDVNRDGRDDLTVSFAAEAAALPRDATEACLSGRFGGTSFRACDALEAPSGR